MKRFAYFVFAFVLLSACRLPKYVAPKMIAPEFQALKISKIGMLPMADLREDISKPFKHADYMRKWLGKNMDVRGYPSSNAGGNKPITKAIASAAELMSYDPKIEPYLGESSFRFVFLPVLTEVSKEGFVVGKTSNVNILGIIYDKQSKRVVWMNEAVGEDTSFMTMSALANVLAVDNAIGNLMAGMPKAKK